MADPLVEKQQAQLDEAFASFERDYPEAAEALRIMNISFFDYLQAMDALKQTSSISGNCNGNSEP